VRSDQRMRLAFGVAMSILCGTRRGLFAIIPQ
jgi:hypothetical protein